jgi:hypothetical protein
MTEPIEKRQIMVDGQAVQVQLYRRTKAASSKRTTTYASVVLPSGEVVSLGDPFARINPAEEELAAAVRRILLIRQANDGSAPPLSPQILARVVQMARAECPTDAHIGARLAQYVLDYVQQQLHGEATFAELAVRGLRKAERTTEMLLRQTLGVVDATEE